MEHGKKYQQASLPKYECLLFDVDDTLYPLSCGLSRHCTQNILEYMVERLGIDEKKAPETNHFLYKNYGTSMAGLRAIGYDFDYDDYHSFVHGRLPYETIKPDYHLRTFLLSLLMRKVISSNADKVHAAKVLSKLGLDDCFEEIICFQTLNPPNNTGHNVSAVPSTCILCKPQDTAFEVALKKANIDPRKTHSQYRGCKACGSPYRVRGTSLKSQNVDFALESIHSMKEVLKYLNN